MYQMKDGKVSEVRPATSWAPQRKITVGGAVGVPLATILAWGLTQAGLEVPGEVQAAMGAVLSILVAYLVPQ